MRGAACAGRCQHWPPSRPAADGSGSRGSITNSHRTGRPVAQAGDQDTGTGPGAKPSVTCTDRSS